MAILLAGALTVVLAVCAVAGLFILRSAGGTPQERIEPARSQQNAQAQPGATFTPLRVVPSACDTVPEEAAVRLAPGSTARPHQGTETDEYSKCNWGGVGTSSSRELSVELRGLPGGQSVQQATATFQQEAAADKEGEGLLQGQRLKHFQKVEDIGEQAYELFITERFQGQGIVRAQVGNVLITVSYGGGASNDTPLGADTCLEGARQVAGAVVEAVRVAAA
ncbi:hypothetical protein [Actinocorallia populi]|uniref:hypothetical protein n=1 Tax=Actinocorallia populi TaxID=2079200 RepID=UPI000D08F64A|nr:hypothetical protein [Actinocorallia populi]